MTFKQHNCNLIQKTGVYIVAEENDIAWCLHIQKEATESDLEENNYLENIGDIIRETEIEILCCPFCGDELPILNSDKANDYGHFQHFDFSRWW